MMFDSLHTLIQSVATQMIDQPDAQQTLMPILSMLRTANLLPSTRKMFQLATCMSALGHLDALTEGVASTRRRGHGSKQLHVLHLLWLTFLSVIPAAIGNAKLAHTRTSPITE